MTLITFEGGEGAGKTTLIATVSEFLLQQNRSCIVTREPGGSPLGQKIRTLLLHGEETSLSPRAELFLFLADRAQHVDEVIFPSLQKGSVVLCDRFHDSTLAYQAAGRGFDESWIQNLSDFSSRGLHPSLTLYLDLEPEIGLRRRDPTLLDRMETEEIAFHHTVRLSYLKRAQQEPDRIITIDASMSQQEVAKHAIKYIERHLKGS